MEDAGTFQSGVTIDQAAVILGASPSTVRRWVKEGKLRSERVTTPQAHAFRVYLDGQVPRSEPSDGGRPPGEPAPATEPAATTSTAAVAAPSMERAEAMTRYNEALLAPLLAELAASRSVILAQTDRIAELARENGTLTERLAGLKRVRDAAMAHAAELEQQLAAAATRPPEPVPDPFPQPIPPTPNVGPRRRPPRWRRWVRHVVLGEWERCDGDAAPRPPALSRHDQGWHGPRRVLVAAEAVQPLGPGERLLLAPPVTGAARSG